MDHKRSEITKLADSVAQDIDADVILYNGPLYSGADTDLIKACAKRRRRTNVVLLLVTEGGSADPAYRIARCLQNNYKRFSLYVSGYCKSAGTLVAIGAHELIISDHGELGPLDVQMAKKDELWETQSGLTVMDTLMALQDNAFMAFEGFFLQLKAKSGDAITLRTATRIAMEMATGLFAPLYNQVDPMHVGEARRAMSIASRYGDRLLRKGGNITPDALGFITSEYPSHGFVIDRQEASTLFSNVREPEPAEVLLVEELDDRALYPRVFESFEGSAFEFLSTELATPENDQREQHNKEEIDEEFGGPARSRRDGASEKTSAQPNGRNGQEDISESFKPTPEGSTSE